MRTSAEGTGQEKRGRATEKLPLSHRQRGRAGRVLGSSLSMNDCAPRAHCPPTGNRPADSGKAAEGACPRQRPRSCWDSTSTSPATHDAGPRQPEWPCKGARLHFRRNPMSRQRQQRPGSQSRELQGRWRALKATLTAQGRRSLRRPRRDGEKLENLISPRTRKTQLNGRQATRLVRQFTTGCSDSQDARGQRSGEEAPHTGVGGRGGSWQVRLRSHGSGSARDPEETSPAAHASPTQGGTHVLPVECGDAAWAHQGQAHAVPTEGPGTCPTEDRGARCPHRGAGDLPHRGQGARCPHRGAGDLPHRGRGRTGQCREPAAGGSGAGVTRESLGSFSAPRGPRGQ